MANFRNGNLVQGQTLGATFITVMLSSNNQVISTGANQAVLLQSNSTDASSRRFIIQSSTITGQQISIIFESVPYFACELLHTPGVGNVRITKLWEPIQYDCITLTWDGQFWVEVSRSNVSGGDSPFNPVITSPSDAQVLIYKTSSTDWENQSISGDATITNAGVLTIGTGAVTSSKIANATIVAADISASAAIAYSQLAPLPSADILVGSAGNVATAATVTGAITMSNTGVTSLSTEYSSPVFIVRGSISSSQILSLSGTPVTILSGVTGFTYIIDSVTIFLIPVTTQYSAGSSINIQTGGATVLQIGSQLLTANSNGAFFARTSYYDIPGFGTTADQFGFNLTPYVGGAITVNVDGANFTLGDTSISYYIYYRMQQLF